MIVVAAHCVALRSSGHALTVSESAESVFEYALGMIETKLQELKKGIQSETTAIMIDLKRIENLRPDLVGALVDSMQECFNEALIVYLNEEYLEPEAFRKLSPVAHGMNTHKQDEVLMQSYKQLLMGLIIQ